LKLGIDEKETRQQTSRPAWARGLKHVIRPDRYIKIVSRPAWARGLKLSCANARSLGIPSRPAWARGLKRTTYNQTLP